MKNLSIYPKIVLIAVFFGLMVFAVHEKYLLFAIGFAAAIWTVVRNQTHKKDLQDLIEAARTDANQYRELWQLECKKNALEHPNEQPKKQTGYEFH